MGNNPRIMTVRNPTQPGPQQGQQQVCSLTPFKLTAVSSFNLIMGCWAILAIILLILWIVFN